MNKQEEIKNIGLTMVLAGLNPYPYVNKELKKLKGEEE